MIRGTTALIAHLGYPTEAFKAPMIYNPYFEDAGIDAVVVPRASSPRTIRACCAPCSSSPTSAARWSPCRTR
ncbi:MAG: hypothetical protein U1E17_09320 [Geminicoccaceae bacterium]